MSDKYIKEITQNIPNNELNAAYDALMNSSLNETSDYEEVSMEELNEYIEGLECQAEDLRAQLAKANERVKNLEAERDKYFEALCMHAQRIPESEWGHNKCAKEVLNKFAIEKKIEALDDLLEEIQCSVVVPKRYEQFQEPYLEGIKHCIQFVECQLKQLRKEQE